MEINPKFFELATEKQNEILNAAMEIFATNEYKRASTEDIARKAGISKGLLFYYFKNKKSLYLYVYNYVLEKTTSFVVDKSFRKITDFFELISYSSKKKAQMVVEHPYIMDFALRSFFSEKEEVSPHLQEEFQRQIDEVYQLYFTDIDTCKFKDNINPFDIYKMILWMSDGYLNEKRRNKERLTVEQMRIDSDKWIQMFREFSYKEEYL